MWLLLTMACIDEDALALEMERGIVATNEAIDAALVAAEMFRWTHASPTVTLRHGAQCGCPCRDRTDAGETFILLADYAELGCFPDSDLLPFPVLGHVTLLVDDAEAEATLDGVMLDGREPVDGSPSATVDALTGQASIRGALDVGPMRAELDVTVRHEPDAVRFDGDIEVPSGSVRLDGVRLRLEDVFGNCPTPSDGVAQVEAEKGPIEVRLALGDDGTTEARYRDRTSSVVPYCAYRPEWW